MTHVCQHYSLLRTKNGTIVDIPGLLTWSSPSATVLAFFMDGPTLEASHPSVASVQNIYDAEILCLSSITLSVTKSSTAERMPSSDVSSNEHNASSSLSFAVYWFQYSKV